MKKLYPAVDTGNENECRDTNDDRQRGLLGILRRNRRSDGGGSGRALGRLNAAGPLLDQHFQATRKLAIVRFQRRG